ncbi:hypothetical protein [Halopiger goleimassiliensis]|uniref:hypothetical protein n=1 Tax=Halopiger goleimassiliensis TaxID=1293048 RepID=UPI000677E37C|nr:hypothetical protein [Halopiger goleimassiliensis]
MDEDAPVDPDDPETIQWHRDATTSRSVRLLWSFGVGTFFAMIAIVVAWRLYELALQGGFEPVVVATVAAIAVTILSLAVDPRAERRLQSLATRLSLSAPSERGLERAIDAAVATLAMGVVIGGLMGLGRLALEVEPLSRIGPGPFTGLAALLLPVALVAFVLSSFLRSSGVLDRDEGVLYLRDPDHAIDLDVIVDVSIRELGDAAVVTLTYAQPDGQYVPGPRRIVVPPAVADELAQTVRGTV